MKTLPPTITAKWLFDHDACDEQRELFEKEWPEGAVVSADALARAAAIGMNLEWFAERVLPRSKFADHRAKCAPLYADYEAKCAPLYADYRAKRDALDADHRAKCDALLITAILSIYEDSAKRTDAKTDMKKEEVMA